MLLHFSQQSAACWKEILASQYPLGSKPITVILSHYLHFTIFFLAASLLAVKHLNVCHESLESSRVEWASPFPSSLCFTWQERDLEVTERNVTGPGKASEFKWNESLHIFSGHWERINLYYVMYLKEYNWIQTDLNSSFLHYVQTGEDRMKRACLFARISGHYTKALVLWSLDGYTLLKTPCFFKN